MRKPSAGAQTERLGIAVPLTSLLGRMASLAINDWRSMSSY
jgi:hypothetical protein